MKNYIKEYGTTWIKNKILAIYSTQAQALEHEIRLHRCFDVKNNDAFLNKTTQTSTKFLRPRGNPLGEEHKNKIRLKACGRKHTLEARKKRPSFNQNPANQGQLRWRRQRVCRFFC